jgi:hypothetical protein
MITNDAGCTCETKSRIVMTKQHSTRKILFLPAKLDLNLRKKVVECYSLNTALYGAETWTLRKLQVGHKSLTKSLTTLCKSQSMRNRWITTICDLIRPRGKSLGGGDLDGRHFVGSHIGFRSNILNGKGVI